ncbi:MAG TPA: FHA domain-containing protein [Aggregatilineales bacterium]|nr:FHA domain-containing protein [Aggregatilineales bacterium]
MDLNAREQTLIISHAEDESNIAGLQLRRAYFGRNSHLCLYVVHSNMTIPCDFSTHTITIGRGQPKNSPDPHLDLSDYGGREMGVSRLHARFIRTNVVLMLKDMGAMNGTFINNERLSPVKTYVVCDGDEIQFANLTVRAQFQ